MKDIKLCSICKEDKLTRLGQVCFIMLSIKVGLVFKLFKRDQKNGIEHINFKTTYFWTSGTSDRMQVAQRTSTLIKTDSSVFGCVYHYLETQFFS